VFVHGVIADSQKGPDVYATALRASDYSDSAARVAAIRLRWAAAAAPPALAPALVPVLAPMAAVTGDDSGSDQPLLSGYPLRLHRASRREQLVEFAAQQAGLARARLARIDIATDLSTDIGSRPWWRGLALMLGLSGAAIAFWPGFASPIKPLAMHINAPAQAGYHRHKIAVSDEAAPAPTTPGTPTLAPPSDALVTTLVTSLPDGNSFGQMLRAVGVGARDAEQVSALITATIPLGEITPGTNFAIALNADGSHALERVEFHTRSDMAIAIARRGASLELSSHGLGSADAALPYSPAPQSFMPSAPLPPRLTDTAPLRIRGPVGASLYRSARAAGAPAQAVQQYLQAMGAHMDIAQLRPDDTFDLILNPAGGGSAGELIYAGLEHDGHPRERLLRWGGGQNGGQFFDAAAQDAAQPARTQPAALIMPVAGHLTSGFGMRFHPILGYTRMHEGIDLSAPWGSPIFAVAPGVVSFAGLHGGHGEYVRLEHSDGIGTGYAHMSRIAVAPGTHVHAGEVIGFVGSSGLSTGAHLHYEVYEDGHTVNPLSFHFPAHASTPGPRDLAAFRARLAKLLLVKPVSAQATLGGHMASR
jgi:murein DD-endopeptidase MepM/ murein hydrolase activator NlpD